MKVLVLYTPTRAVRMEEHAATVQELSARQGHTAELLRLHTDSHARSTTILESVRAGGGDMLVCFGSRVPLACELALQAKKAGCDLEVLLVNGSPHTASRIRRHLSRKGEEARVRAIRIDDRASPNAAQKIFCESLFAET